MAALCCMWLEPCPCFLLPVILLFLLFYLQIGLSYLKKLFSFTVPTILPKLDCDGTGYAALFFRENFFSDSSQHHRPAAHAAQPEAEEPPPRYPGPSTTRGHPRQGDNYSSGGHRSHHPDRYDSSPERSSYHDTSSRLSGGHLPRRDSPPRSEYHSRHTIVWNGVDGCTGFSFCPVQSFQNVPDPDTVRYTLNVETKPCSKSPTVPVHLWGCNMIYIGYQERC
jgi:hypothetical protein